MGILVPNLSCTPGGIVYPEAYVAISSTPLVVHATPPHCTVTTAYHIWASKAARVAGLGALERRNLTVTMSLVDENVALVDMYRALYATIKDHFHACEDDFTHVANSHEEPPNAHVDQPCATVTQNTIPDSNAQSPFAKFSAETVAKETMKF